METFFPTSIQSIGEAMASSIPTPEEETLRESFDRQAAEIVTLKSNLDSMTKNFEYQSTRANRAWSMIRDFEEALKNAVTEDIIDEDLASEFAGIFDIQLTKDVAVMFMITARGTVTVPIDQEAELVNWEHMLDVDISVNGDYDSDLYVDSVEMEVE